MVLVAATLGGCGMDERDQSRFAEVRVVECARSAMGVNRAVGTVQNLEDRPAGFAIAVTFMADGIVLDTAEKGTGLLDPGVTYQWSIRSMADVVGVPVLECVASVR
jgi:hypothetical protein